MRPLYIMLLFLLTMLFLMQSSWCSQGDLGLEAIPSKLKLGARYDYQILAKFYPRIKQIQPIVVEENTFYVLVRNKKIKGIMSAWESTHDDIVVWLMMNDKSQIQEILFSPTMTKIDLSQEQVRVINQEQHDFGQLAEALEILQKLLGEDWSAFIRKIKLNIHKSDAVTQATP